MTSLTYTDHVEIGPVPSEEQCIQVGEPGYNELARIECKRFIELLRKKLGIEPAGAKLVVREFPHDFGSYMEVVCMFDRYMEAAADYAYRLETEAPSKWEE